MRGLKAAPVAMALATLAPVAHSHPVGSDATAGRIALEGVLVALMLASALGYAIGVARLWRRAGAGRGISGHEVFRFTCGWSVLAAALLPPIDTLADGSFAVHMVQHELLMVVAAPLLVASRTFEAWAWALRGGGVRVLSTLAAGWRWLATPRRSWWLHAAALWLWHVPAFFDAALENISIHALQHLSFFGSALLFWWAVYGRGIRAREGTAFALLLTTMLHMNALGLLLTFAPTAWYVHGSSLGLGMTALEDQQLGGLVMWMLGSMAYLGAALAVVAAWMMPRQRPNRASEDDAARSLSARGSG
jgi:putative membrane protein